MFFNETELKTLVKRFVLVLFQKHIFIFAGNSEFQLQAFS